MERRFNVSGRPVPQPRTQSTASGRHYTPDNGVKDYKYHIRVIAKLEGCKPVRGPVAIEMTFTFSRPPSHFTKAGVLRKGAPDFPGHGCGDTDNLAKAVKDALIGIAYVDDTQVVDERSVKRWGDRDGTTVRLS